MTTSSGMQGDETLESMPPRRLYRSRRSRVVAGICGGLGEYFAVDPIWFRIGFIVLAIGGGSGVLIYLLMWLIVPEEPEGHVPQDSGKGTVTGGAAIVGMVLVSVGTISLVNTTAPWLGRYIWPVVLIVGGLALAMGGLRRDRDR